MGVYSDSTLLGREGLGESWVEESVDFVTAIGRPIHQLQEEDDSTATNQIRPVRET